MHTYHRREGDPEGHNVEHTRGTLHADKVVWRGLFGLVGLLLTLLGVFLLFERANVYGKIDSAAATAGGAAVCCAAVDKRAALTDERYEEISRSVNELKAGQAETQKLVRELLARK